jgi:hypothetical protein
LPNPPPGKEGEPGKPHSPHRFANLCNAALVALRTLRLNMVAVFRRRAKEKNAFARFFSVCHAHPPPRLASARQPKRQMVTAAAGR